jgi:hypothetical protein
MALGLAAQLGAISTEQRIRSVVESQAGGFFVSAAVCCRAVNEAVLGILRHSGTVLGPSRLVVLLEARTTQEIRYMKLDGFK